MMLFVHLVVAGMIVTAALLFFAAGVVTLLDPEHRIPGPPLLMATGQHVCKECGVPLSYGGLGRPREFCSRRHSKAFKKPDRECSGCGERLTHRSMSGLCGFCEEERQVTV